MQRLGTIVLGSILMGILLCLALPPADFGAIGFFALVPAMVALRQTSLVYGLLSGLLSCAITAWLVNSGFPRSPQHPGESPAWTYTGLMLFGVVIGLGLGVFASLKEVRIPQIMLLAAWAVMFEFASMVALPMHLALTQHQSLLALILASLGGIWAVSALLWAVNAWFATWVSNRERGDYRLGIALGIVAISIVPPIHIAEEVLVATIQTKSTSPDVLEKLHRDASRRAELVVWPELAGEDLAANGETSLLRDISRVGKPFVTSYRDDIKPKPHNTAALFHGGKESDRYWKRKLFAGEKDMHRPGTRAVAVPWAYGKLGLNICFDSCYPSVMRETALLPGVNVIALPTLDPDTPHGFAQAIHAAYTPFRSAELGVPIVRADTTGYSRVYTPFGLLNSGSLNPDSVQVKYINLRPLRTPYRQYGDWFLWLSALAVPILSWPKKRSSAPAKVAEV